MRAASAATPSVPPGVTPALVASAAAGNQAAFAHIYRHCAPGVRRYVRSIVWDEWDADDVTQEVFVKIFVGLSQYDATRAPFCAWMLRIARNAAIDHLRRTRARPAPLPVDQQAPLDDAGHRCVESLREVLHGLGDKEREILVLRALGGLTPPELAARLNRSRGSVNTLYHRARVAARESLAANAAGPSTIGAPEPDDSARADPLPVAA